MPLTEAGRNSCNQNHGRTLGVYNDGSIMCVAAQGAIGDWAAYSMRTNRMRGPEFDTDAGHIVIEDYVKHHGTKMYAEHAFELFPWLNKEHWRA